VASASAAVEEQALGWAASASVTALEPALGWAASASVVELVFGRAAPASVLGELELALEWAVRASDSAMELVPGSEAELALVRASQAEEALQQARETAKTLGKALCLGSSSELRCTRTASSSRRR
jgi:hypothetical protein